MKRYDYIQDLFKLTDDYQKSQKIQSVNSRRGGPQSTILSTEEKDLKRNVSKRQEELDEFFSGLKKQRQQAIQEAKVIALYNERFHYQSRQEQREELRA